MPMLNHYCAPESTSDNQLIRGILIDVHNLTVQEVAFKNNLLSFYRLLNCDVITTAPYPYDDHHDIVVDDESLLKELQNFFAISPEEEYCGNGLIIRSNSDGEWVSHSLDVEAVRKQITFHKYVKFGFDIFKINLKRES